MRGVKLPLVQAPMAGVQDAELAVAVCNAGAMGSLPGAMLGVDELRRQIELISARVSGPYNVNFFCHAIPVADSGRLATWHRSLGPYLKAYGIDAETIPTEASRLPFSDEMLAVLADYEVPVVSFHFGLPAKSAIEAIKGWGGAVWSSATTLDEAIWLETHGADVIIAQGWEAGGHRGHFLSDDLALQPCTVPLLEQILSRVSVPVVAAGGIATSEHVRQVLEAGAIAAQVGTAFLLCDETDASAVYRAALTSARANHTAVTNVFTGRPARGIVNRLVREQGPMSNVAPTFPLAGNAVTALKVAAEAQGIDDFSTLWCGKNPQGCAEVPAALMVRRLCDGLQ